MLLVLLVTLVCYFTSRDIVFVSILVSVEILRSYFETTRAEVAVLLEKASWGLVLD